MRRRTLEHQPSVNTRRPLPRGRSRGSGALARAEGTQVGQRRRQTLLKQSEAGRHADNRSGSATVDVPRGGRTDCQEVRVQMFF